MAHQYALRESTPSDLGGDRTPLDILESLRRADDELLRRSHGRLSESSVRFETSLTATLQRQGILPAVRTALLFGEPAENISPGQDRDDRELVAAFSRVPRLRREPELAVLARNLLRMRWRCHRFLSGAAPLSYLAPWTDYLRRESERFARRREVTRREAVSYAHYALHLTNICDAPVCLPGDLTEALRERLMVVEDELKAFATDVA